MKNEIFGFSGSRNENIPEFQKVALEIILNALSSRWKKTKIVVGDCPTGIDKYVIDGCKKRNLNYTIFKVIGERTGKKLRERTIDMVTACTFLISFPKSLNAVSSGTWLATWEACRQNKKVRVCWAHHLVNDLNKEFPKIKSLRYWSYVNTKSCLFVTPVCHFTPIQERLKLDV